MHLDLFVVQNVKPCLGFLGNGEELQTTTESVVDGVWPVAEAGAQWQREALQRPFLRAECEEDHDGYQRQVGQQAVGRVDFLPTHGVGQCACTDRDRAWASRQSSGSSSQTTRST